MTDEVKPTITSRPGWGRRAGPGSQDPLASCPAALAALLFFSKSQAVASGSEGRGAIFFLLSSLRGPFRAQYLLSFTIQVQNQR